MKTYEVIKEMSVDEMATIFYLFLKPFCDAFDLTEEQKKAVREKIRAFLNTERTEENENRRSEEKS